MELEQKTAGLQQTLLRISGAIEVCEESRAKGMRLRLRAGLRTTRHSRADR